LRRGGYRSIRQGLRELAYEIEGILALGGVPTAPEPRARHTFRQSALPGYTAPWDPPLPALPKLIEHEHPIKRVDVPSTGDRRT